MKVCVVGAGSVGGVLGAKLAAVQDGHEISLIARGAHLAAIRAQGLTLVDHIGPHSGNYRLPASDEPRDFGRQDLVVLALKAHQIAAMLPKMAPLIGPQTVVLPAINGIPWWYFHRHGGPHEGWLPRSLDPDGTMLDALDCRQVLGCVVHIASEVRAPGEVHHTQGPRLIFGELDQTETQRLRAVSAMFSLAGFKSEVAGDIRLAVWTKLLGNLSFNPVATLTGQLMDAICADEALLDILRAIIREGIAVAERYGKRIAMTPDQRIDIGRLLGACKVSMLQDLEQHRPLELGAIVSVVLELAERVKVPMPTTRIIHDLVRARAGVLGLA